MPVKVCLCFQKLPLHITVMHSKELSCIARNFKRPRLVFSALVLDGVLVHLKRFGADLLFVKPLLLCYHKMYFVRNEL